MAASCKPILRIARGLLASIVLACAASAACADAVDDLVRRAESGDAQAQYDLGERLARGEGVKQDHASARIWFERALAQGNRDALFLYAVAYAEGGAHLGVAKDPEKATAAFERAAALGDTRAQLALGVRYIEGEGAAVDPDRAAMWLERAAEASDANMQLALASMYDTGTEGVRQSDAKAQAWATRAAQRGHGEAQLWLARRHARGKGAPKDARAAYRWASLAAVQDTPGASLVRDEIAAMLAPDERESIDAEIRARAGR